MTRHEWLAMLDGPYNQRDYGSLMSWFFYRKFEDDTTVYRLSFIYETRRFEVLYWYRNVPEGVLLPSLSRAAPLLASRLSDRQRADAIAAAIQYQSPTVRLAP